MIMLSVLMAMFSASAVLIVSMCVSYFTSSSEYSIPRSRSARVAVEMREQGLLPTRRANSAMIGALRRTGDMDGIMQVA